MNRRSIIRVLLSLVLLVSQQMAFTHAISHWAVSSNASASPRNDGAGKKAAAHDQNCVQCFAFAQLASAVGSPFRTFPAIEAASSHQTAPATPADCLRTICVFQSRAPPQA